MAAVAAVGLDAVSGKVRQVAPRWSACCCRALRAWAAVPCSRMPQATQPGGLNHQGPGPGQRAELNELDSRPLEAAQ